MPTPVGHGLAGMAIALLSQRPKFIKPAGFVAVIVVLANLPDADFIPGLLFGDATRFHWGPTHSITAALAAGVCAGLLCWRWSGEFMIPALITTAAWGSHILLDLLLGPVRGSPYGLALFWPFGDQRVMLPWSVFRLYPGGAINENPFTALLQPRAWSLVERELLVLVPVVMAAFLLRRLRTANRSQLLGHRVKEGTNQIE